MTQIPEGWKLVPVEPTAQMVTLGMGISGDMTISAHQMRHAYQAMLAASPAPQSTEGQGDLIQELRNRRVMVDLGNGNITDEPDLEAALRVVERQATQLSAMRKALERSKKELELASEQWGAPSVDGLFRSRVSVLLDVIEAALSPPGNEIDGDTKQKPGGG